MGGGLFLQASRIPRSSLEGEDGLGVETGAQQRILFFSHRERDTAAAHPIAEVSRPGDLLAADEDVAREDRDVVGSRSGLGEGVAEHLLHGLHHLGLRELFRDARRDHDGIDGRRSIILILVGQGRSCGGRRGSDGRLLELLAQREVDALEGRLCEQELAPVGREGQGGVGGRHLLELVVAGVYCVRPWVKQGCGVLLWL